MKRQLHLFIKIILIATIIIIPLSNTVLANDNTIDIVVSPNVLNIESNGGSISIHTDFHYVQEADVSMEVNETPIDNINTFADNCGNLVVKCSIDTVKTLVAGSDEAAFILIINDNGETYIGTDTIAVIQIIPQKT